MLGRRIDVEGQFRGHCSNQREIDSTVVAMETEKSLGLRDLEEANRQDWVSNWEGNDE